jgi:hypothetical protein
MKPLVKRLTKYGLIVFVITITLANAAGFTGRGTVQADAWYNFTWLYRKQITINAASGGSDLTNFPILISLTSDTALGSHAQLDGDDILFTAADKTTKLDHEIEKYSSNGTSANLTAWVRFPTLSASSTTTVFMYYGNASASSQQNMTGVWDSNYKMVQHLEETTSSMTDSTQYTNNATAFITAPGTLGTTGYIDGASSFDGNDQITCKNSSIILPSNANLTFSAWVNLSVINAGTFAPNRVFTILENASNSNIALGIGANGTITGFTRNGAAAAEFSGGSVTTGQWYYLTLVKSGSTHQLYLNGVASGSALTATPTNQPSANPAMIGRDWGSGTRYFSGTIDEVAISNIPRSAGWIATSYANQNNPTGFITLGSEETAPTLPTVTTSAASSVEETSANLTGNITATGGDNPAERGFEWSTDAGFATSSNWTEIGSFGTGEFSHALAAATLNQGTLYYYRAMAKNTLGWAYGASQTFLTKPEAPAIFTATPDGSDQIDLSWIKGAGANNTMVRGKLGSYPASVSDGYQVYFNTGLSASDTGLIPSTTYYYRAWSEVTNGSQQWSDTYLQSSATTGVAIVPPSVSTNAATSVDETTATISGTLTNNGGEDCNWILEWGTGSGSYTANTTWSVATITTGQTFTHNFIGLSRGAKYYYRAGVKNSAGTVYGTEQDFLTKPAVPASFTATTIGDHQIDLAWTMGDGAGRIMIRVRTDTYPTSYTDGTQVYFGSDTSFSCTSLDSGTTYYYAAWSEKTGSQQWSNLPAQASAATSGSPPSPSVGGDVFSVNKIVILAPWLAGFFAFCLIIAMPIVLIRKQHYLHSGKGCNKKISKATGRRL